MRHSELNKSIFYKSTAFFIVRHGIVAVAALLLNRG